MQGLSKVYGLDDEPNTSQTIALRLSFGKNDVVRNVEMRYSLTKGGWSKNVQVDRYICLAGCVAKSLYPVLRANGSTSDFPV